MSDAPQDPYRPFGQPEDREPGEPGSAYPPYTPYAEPQAYPPPPHGHAQSPYGYGAPAPQGFPGQPGQHPAQYPAQYPGQYPAQYSDKSKTTAGLLQLLLPFVGVCGVGRLYAGHTTIGVLQLVLYWVSFPLVLVFIGFPMLIGIWLWSVIDGIIMLSSASVDGQGRLLR